MDPATPAAETQRAIPEFKLDNASLASLIEDPAAAVELAIKIVAKLREAPHVFLLCGLDPVEEAKPVRRLARAIADLPGPIDDPTRPVSEKLSFTRVRIADSDALNHEKVTRYSRTNQPLCLHTDSSNIKVPHDLVAFQMVRADREGGETLLATVEDICSALPADVLGLLKQALFPFSRQPLPILWEANGRSHIRYYRSQIETALKRGGFLSSEANYAMAVLDEVLESTNVQQRVRLEPGQTLFLANTQVLHGRTGFEPDSKRLMYRVRAYASSLV